MLKLKKLLILLVRKIFSPMTEEDAKLIASYKLPCC